MSHELRFERVFDASPEEVFDAYTDPVGLEEMYGLDDPGWIVESGGSISVERFVRKRVSKEGPDPS